MSPLYLPPLSRPCICRRPGILVLVNDTDWELLVRVPSLALAFPPITSMSTHCLVFRFDTTSASPSPQLIRMPTSSPITSPPVAPAAGWPGVRPRSGRQRSLHLHSTRGMMVGRTVVIVCNRSSPSINVPMMASALWMTMFFVTSSVIPGEYFRRWRQVCRYIPW